MAVVLEVEAAMGYSVVLQGLLIPPDLSVLILDASQVFDWIGFGWMELDWLVVKNVGHVPR
jgi:hypothetical protein